MENYSGYRLPLVQKLIYFMIIWVGLAQAYSQPIRRSAQWSIGKVALRSGEELQGNLSYDQAHEMVLLQMDGALKTYSAQQVLSFQFIEESLGILRRFAAYPFRRGASGTRLHFFEVILRGPMVVLRRDVTPQELSLSQLPSAQPSPTYDYVTDFSYYIYYQGQWVEMARFHKAFLPLLMKKYPSELPRLIKDKKWSRLTLADKVRLINTYNFLENEPPPLPVSGNEGLPVTRNGHRPDSLVR